MITVDKIKNEVKYIIQGMVEQGILEYFTKEDGKLYIIKGKNFGKNMDLPKTIAGKKMKYTNGRVYING